MSAGRWIGVAIVAWVAWKGYCVLASVNAQKFAPIPYGGVVPYRTGVGNGTTPPGTTAGVDPSTGRPLF